MKLANENSSRFIAATSNYSKHASIAKIVVLDVCVDNPTAANALKLLHLGYYLGVPFTLKPRQLIGHNVYIHDWTG